MKFNNDNGCFGYSADTLESRYKDNQESMPTAVASSNSAKQNLHKSCDTIDQDSGLNYYALHSIISYAAEKNNCFINKTNNKSYDLHDISIYSNEWNDKFHYNNTFRQNDNCRKIFATVTIPVNHHKRKYVLVNRLPHSKNYSVDDDSVYDPLRQYINDCVELKNFVQLLCQQQIVKVVQVATNVAEIILVSNISQYFDYDFKQYNFDLTYVNYC